MPIYNDAKKAFQDGDIDLLNDNIRVALLTSSYTPNIDTDTFWSDISANEASATTGYTAGGELLTGKTTTVDTAADDSTFDAADQT